MRNQADPLAVARRALGEYAGGGRVPWKKLAAQLCDKFEYYIEQDVIVQNGRRVYRKELMDWNCDLVGSTMTGGWKAVVRAIVRDTPERERLGNVYNRNKGL